MKKIFLLITLFSLLFTSCGTAPASNYTYQQPENLDDGLAVGTLDEVGIDPALIGQAVDRIREGKYNEVHSLLIYKDDKLVLEEYFVGHRFQWDAPYYHGRWVYWANNKPHEVMSVGKSFTSAVIGIAIEEGFIESVNQSIFDYLPQHQYLNTDGKDAITIEHLLTMTAGLAWAEWNTAYTDPNNSSFNLWINCDDQVACILEAPLVKDPGTHFNYSAGCMILLGEIIKNASGMNIEEFAAVYLHEPLGINPPEISKFESGIVAADGNFALTPREMTKFGITYLNRGVWDGEQIIPAAWVDKSAIPYRNNVRIKIPGTDAGRNGYAYTWWIKEYRHNGQKINLFYASGWGGQEIMIFPELNTIVVFTAGNYTTKTTAFRILEKYILPAIE
ncbi:MAG: serine hydrolase [Anaerolineaceae bacterium]|nr:serine hydrolase [Anaerolineaceae bacterium]